jgi:hypothetical protein
MSGRNYPRYHQTWRNQGKRPARCLLTRACGKLLRRWDALGFAFACFTMSGDLFLPYPKLELPLALSIYTLLHFSDNFKCFFKRGLFVAAPRPPARDENLFPERKWVFISLKAFGKASFFSFLRSADGVGQHFAGIA